MGKKVVKGPKGRGEMVGCKNSTNINFIKVRNLAPVVK